MMRNHEIVKDRKCYRKSVGKFKKKFQQPKSSLKCKREGTLAGADPGFHGGALSLDSNIHICCVFNRSELYI